VHPHHIIHERPHLAPADESVTKRRADKLLEIILRRQMECCKDMEGEEWAAKLKETKVKYMVLTDAMMKGAGVSTGQVLTPQEEENLFRPPGVGVYVPGGAP
jgi:hypothetical protein